jgi:NAD(P)-dependent dehydrogenase (short-subunit alcohol dehydrogenase family)
MQTSPETMHHVQQVNLVAPMMLSQKLIGPLKETKGAIVNVSSIAAHRVHQFAGSAYAISKAGLSTFTRELAHELGETGVRVNAVAPGEIKTSILSPGTDEMVEEDVPMRRLGNPEEVAEVVYFLCGPHASYVTGSEIHINGGQHI